MGNENQRTSLFLLSNEHYFDLYENIRHNALRPMLALLVLLHKSLCPQTSATGEREKSQLADRLLCSKARINGSSTYECLSGDSSEFIGWPKSGGCPTGEIVLRSSILNSDVKFLLSHIVKLDHWSLIVEIWPGPHVIQMC